LLGVFDYLCAPRPTVWIIHLSSELHREFANHLETIP
jgi:hypothetical protein